MDIDYPPPTTLIREFYSNLSIHVYDSNTLVKSWIRDVKFTITPRVVADALGVPIVPNPIYPYDASPPLDDIMSYITDISIHIYDSNTLVKSWVRGVEYTITPRVVVDALRVLLVQHPVYPYDESPPLDDIMS